jgi:hypothetical protein
MFLYQVSFLSKRLVGLPHLTFLSITELNQLLPLLINYIPLLLIVISVLFEDFVDKYFVRFTLDLLLLMFVVDLLVKNAADLQVLLKHRPFLSLILALGKFVIGYAFTDVLSLLILHDLFVFVAVENNISHTVHSRFNL